MKIATASPEKSFRGNPSDSQNNKEELLDISIECYKKGVSDNESILKQKAMCFLNRNQYLTFLILTFECTVEMHF